MKKSCQMYEWVMSLIYIVMILPDEGVMSHIYLVMQHIYIYTVMPLYIWVMSNAWTSHVTCINTSCPYHECIMSHIWMRHVIYTHASCHICEHVCHTCEWVKWSTCIIYKQAQTHQHTHTHLLSYTYIDIHLCIYIYINEDVHVCM